MTAINRVRAYVQQFDPDLYPITYTETTASVEEAAKVVGVEPAQIAKSILFKACDRFGLFVLAGDVRVNQKVVKRLLNGRPKMASPEEVQEVTGFSIGGVCPFAMNREVPVFLDQSMQRFEKVYTAAGTPQSALPITFEQLVSITNGTVIDAGRVEEVSECSARV